MERCFKCGISGERVKLYDAISGEGIVKVCERCALDGDIPVIKKSNASLEDADRNAPVGGLIREREKIFEQGKYARKAPTPSKQDFTLRDLVEKNYKENMNKQEKFLPGLIRNFNWIIMRARRNKGLGQKHLAEMIGEPEIAIRMAERGNLPKEYVPFIRKIEKVLGVDLMENNPFRLEEHKKMLHFKESSSKEITIRDIRGMNKKEKEMIESRELIAKKQAEEEAKKAQELLDENLESEILKEEKETEKKESFTFFKKFFPRKSSSEEKKEEATSLEK